MYQFEAVILAGGRSQRMGKDKALLPFGGYSTLTEYQYQKLLKNFKKVSISTKDNKFPFNAPLILDRVDSSSPLIALKAILSNIQSDVVFILGVDLPFIGKDIIDTLIKSYDKNERAKAIIAKSPQGLEPLCGIYTKALLPSINDSIDNNNHRLQELLNNKDTIFINFKDSKAFMNLNNPKIYKEALRVNYLTAKQV